LTGLQSKVLASVALDALYKKSSWLAGIQFKNHQRTPHWTIARRVLLFIIKKSLIIKALA
jgi:hypothetical protein